MVLNEYSLHEQPIRMVSSKAQITEPDIAAIITRFELPEINKEKKFKPHLLEKLHYKVYELWVWHYKGYELFNFCILYMSRAMRKMCLMSYANNKGAEQPAHPRSLISAFVVRSLDSIISLDSTAEISRL